MSSIRRFLVVLGLTRRLKNTDGSAINNNLELINTRFGFATGNKKTKGVNPLFLLMYSKENEILFI